MSDYMIRKDSEKYTYRKRIDPDIDEAYERIKRNYRERSRTLVGRQMFTPSSSGGTTDNGNTARIFFSYEKREAVLNMMEEVPEPPPNATRAKHDEYKRKVEDKKKFKDVIRKLLQNFSVILNIMNSDKMVRIEEYAELCTSTALLIREEIPWAEFSPTTHLILMHSPQMIKDNNGRGLLAYSEEGAEGNHKLIKNIREKGARKMSLNRNLRDVMKKLYISSNPKFRKFKHVKSCSHCKVEGHSVRSCPLKQNNPKNEDEILFDSLTYENDE